MQKSYRSNKFLKQVAIEESIIDIGSYSCNKAFGIPIGFCLEINSPSYTGQTAIALEIAKDLSNDYLVIYCNYKSSVYLHRLHGINLDNFLLITGMEFGKDEFIEILKNLSDAFPSVIILDNIDYLIKIWNYSYKDLILDIQKECPKVTLVTTKQSSKLNIYDSYVVNLTYEKNIYFEHKGLNLLMGHTVRIAGPKGISISYIDHSTGRISKAYDHVAEKRDQGISANASFELDGIKHQGQWNFIHNYTLGK